MLAYCPAECQHLNLRMIVHCDARHALCHFKIIVLHLQQEHTESNCTELDVFAMRLKVSNVDTCILQRIFHTHVLTMWKKAPCVNSYRAIDIVRGRGYFIVGDMLIVRGHADHNVRLNWRSFPVHCNWGRSSLRNACMLYRKEKTHILNDILHGRVNEVCWSKSCTDDCSLFCSLFSQMEAAQAKQLERRCQDIDQMAYRTLLCCTLQMLSCWLKHLHKHCGQFF